MDLKKYFDKGISFDQFKENIFNDVEKTEIPYHNYIKLNKSRISRYEKTAVLDDTIFDKSKYTACKNIILIGENWCGDIGNNIVYINRIAQLYDINFRVVYRDENTELIDAFLTNGGRAIPIVLFLDSEYQLLGKWGPRPKAIQSFMEEEKKKTDFNKEKVLEEIQSIYNKNKGEYLQKDLSEIFFSL